jgi:uncharacterized protein
MALPAMLAVGLLAAAPAARAQNFPEYTSTTVNDFANLLPEEQERALSRRLDRLERETGVELAVVTLATQELYAPGQTLEQFATALFDHWGIGKAETDDGVLILVLRDDRAMRLELGAAYGRDWDRVAQDVVERQFLDAFAAGDYPRGLIDGTEATIERIVLPFRDGAEAPAPSEAPDWLILVGFALVAALAMARRRIGDTLARLRSCPGCGRRGLSQTRTTLSPASRTIMGMGERVLSCRYCGFEERETFQIPRIRSNRSGGSFGGGRSGGGGASGRW